MADQSDLLGPAGYSPAKPLRTSEEQQIEIDLDIAQKIRSFLANAGTFSPPACPSRISPATIECPELPSVKVNMTESRHLRSDLTTSLHLGNDMTDTQVTSREIKSLKPLEIHPMVVQPLEFIKVHKKQRRILYFKMLAKGHRRAKRSYTGLSAKPSRAVARQPWVCRLVEDQRDVSQ